MTSCFAVKTYFKILNDYEKRQNKSCCPSRPVGNDVDRVRTTRQAGNASRIGFRFGGSPHPPDNEL